MRTAQWIHAAEIELSPSNKMLEACPAAEDIIKMIEDESTELFLLSVNSSPAFGSATNAEFLPLVDLKVFFKGELVLHCERAELVANDQ